MKEITVEQFELENDLEEGSILRNNSQFKLFLDHNRAFWLPKTFDYSNIKKLDLSFFLNNNHTVDRSLDIGAGIGVSSSALSDISNTIDAWEIGTIAFDCLTANFDNAVKTYAVGKTFNKHHIAITDWNLYSTEIVEFEDDYTKNSVLSNSSSGFSDINSKKNYTLVKQQTVDSYEYNNVDIINIDTNGYELKVLQGAKETIANCKPFIIMSLNDSLLSLYGNKIQEVISLLNQLNYTEVSSGIYTSKQ